MEKGESKENAYNWGKTLVMIRSAVEIGTALLREVTGDTMCAKVINVNTNSLRQRHTAFNAALLCVLPRASTTQSVSRLPKVQPLTLFSNQNCYRDEEIISSMLQPTARKMFLYLGIAISCFLVIQLGLKAQTRDYRSAKHWSALINDPTLQLKGLIHVLKHYPDQPLPEVEDGTLLSPHALGVEEVIRPSEWIRRLMATEKETPLVVFSKVRTISDNNFNLNLIPWIFLDILSILAGSETPA